MTSLRLLVLFGVLLPVSAGAAGAARRAAVTVLDSGIRPVQVRVDVAGTVTWTNRGHATHLVTSRRGTWRAFRLRPGRSKAVTMHRRGCERYTVDGSFNGAVLVGISQCGSSSARTFHYDVHAEGFVEVEDTWSDQQDPALNGTSTGTVRWTGTWRNVGVKRTDVLTQFYLIGNARGRIEGELVYSNSRPAETCSGRQGISVANASLHVSGFRQRSGATTVSFDSTSPASLEPTVCPNHSPVPYEAPEPTVGDVKIGVFAPNLNVRFVRTGRAVLFPLDRLKNGAAFTVDTGARTESQTCSNVPCTKVLRYRATVRFTPRRG